MARCDSSSAVSVAIVLLAPAVGSPQRSSEPFVPVGVWYGGGTSRAPMVSRDPAAERDGWRRDLAAIKSLGFNSIKTWVDWASAEPERGRYRLDALEQLLSLADEAGLRVIVQIYTDAAPEWLGERYPDSSFVTDQGTRIGSQASPGYCLDHAGFAPTWWRSSARCPRRAARHHSFYARRCLERAAPRELGLVQHAGRVLLLPAHAGAFPRVAEAEIPDARRASTPRGIARSRHGTKSTAPRFGTILSYTDFIDWKTFIADKLRGGSQAEGGCVRAARARGRCRAIPMRRRSC